MKEMNHQDNPKPTTKKMIQSLGLNLIGTLLMVWVFAHNCQAWDARTWGHPANFMANYPGAIMGAVFTWVGFYLPQDFNKISFQNKSWKLFFIDTTYNLASILTAAIVLASFSK